MDVYHGTAARFPTQELTYGPDTSATLGAPMPGLWLTTDPALAAIYASWSADCTKSKHLRVITLKRELHKKAMKTLDEIERMTKPHREGGNTN